MSVLNAFPTANCVYIGHPGRPLRMPQSVAFSVRSYLVQVALLTEPDEVCWCAGTGAEQVRGRVQSIGSSLGSPPVVMVCSPHPGEVAGPRYWTDPTLMRQRLRRELNGVMRGRTLQVVGFATADHLGILATDSPELMRSVAAVAMTGDEPLARIAAGERWRTVVHCRKGPLGEGSCVVRFPGQRRDLGLGTRAPRRAATRP